MKTHATRLAELLQRGFTCEHFDAFHNPVSHAGEPLRSVYLEGPIHGVPQCLFLSINTGLVMVIRGADYEFVAFLEYLDGVPAVVVERVKGRSLFGDEG